MSPWDYCRDYLTKYLEGGKKLDKAAGPCQGRGPNLGEVLIQEVSFYTNHGFLNKAVKWNALRIAGSVQKNRQGFPEKNPSRVLENVQGRLGGAGWEG